MDFSHIPVMLKETIDSLNIKSNGIYVDCTLGGGGHSKEIIKSIGENGRLIGIDQDEDALNATKERLKEYKNITFVHDNFRNIKNILSDLNIPKVDGILMDLGVSSYQLDNPERGFSYMNDAPLDMRMNREDVLTAYDVVNNYDESDLCRVIRDYGEENFAKRIATFIVNKRSVKPINTTLELTETIKEAIPARFRREGPHPAKRTFQAIRIEVNGELKILDGAVEDSVSCLKEGGRISIITFHSLEDRIVKRKFRALESPCTCPKDLPFCVCGNKPIIRVITRKPVSADEEELTLNPRSRSANLRVGEKL